MGARATVGTAPGVGSGRVVLPGLLLALVALAFLVFALGRYPVGPGLLLDYA